MARTVTAPRPAILLILLVHGMPVLLYRNDIVKPERMLFAPSASVTSLGLVVVITQIGLQSNTMNPDIAQALIGAALLSSLRFPTLAGSLLLRSYAAIGAPMTRRQE